MPDHQDQQQQGSSFIENISSLEVLEECGKV